MERFRHPVELGRSADHLPAGIQAELLHHRRHPAQDLGDAATGPGRVDVDDLLALQPGGHLTEALNFVVTDDLFVAIEHSHTRACAPYAVTIMTAWGSERCWRKMPMNSLRSWLRFKK